MNYAAVFIDVDGTLVSPDSNQLPSERTRETLQKAMSLGVYAGLATARPMQQCLHIIEHLSLRGPSVFSGGAEIVDTETKTPLRELVLTSTQLAQFFEIVQSRHHSYWIQDDGVDCEYDASYIPYKPYIAIAHDVPLETAEIIIAECHRIEGVTALRASGSHSGVVNIHIAHTDATKEKGVEYVANLLSIPKEKIVGIGDGFNDVLLMNACGLKIAMEDSVPELLKIADYVAPSALDDGVAVAIDRFLLAEKME